VAQTLKGGESGPNERLCVLVLRRWDDFRTVFGALTAVRMILEARSPLE
jgi:hypothetical protein